MKKVIALSLALVLAATSSVALAATKHHRPAHAKTAHKMHKAHAVHKVHKAHKARKVHKTHTVKHTHQPAQSRPHAY